MDTATLSMPIQQEEDRDPSHVSTSAAIPANLNDGTENNSDSYDLSVRDKQTEIIERMLKLQRDLIDRNSECERLKIKLDESNRTADNLRCEIDECKLTMLETNEDSKKVHEEVQKNKTLEEDYVKLMSNFLNLSERYEQERQNVYDKFMAKTNTIKNHELMVSHEAIKHELDLCKAELNVVQADVSALSARLRNMDEEKSVKDKCITELRKSLDDAKVTHKHEITVLEEYIQCLKNTIISYEKTLATYIDGSENNTPEGPKSQKTHTVGNSDT